MPISDTYLVQYLLQETLAASAPLIWQERDASGPQAHRDNVEIVIGQFVTRAGSRIQLTLAWESERVSIMEPLRVGLFTEQYANQDDWELANLLRQLSSAVNRQIAARGDRGPEEMKTVRESIFRRVMGMKGPDQD